MAVHVDRSCRPTLQRPAKVVPSACSYKSIQALRVDITRRGDAKLSEKLRSCTFVGCVSRTRSLIQVGVELLLISHHELAKELFFQLALARFGSVGTGTLGGVDVVPCIEQVRRKGAGGGVMLAKEDSRF